MDTVAPGGTLENASLVTPMGKVEVHGTLPIFAFPGATGTDTDVAIAVGGTFGVVDKLEVGADYGHNISPSDGNGTLNAHAAFMALHQDKLDLALAADITIPLDSGQTYNLSIGAWARYHVAPKISLFTGNPGLPHTTQLGGFPLFSGTYQLSFGLNNDNPAILVVPVGVGFQATPQLYAFVDTTIAAFSLHDSTSAYLFSDFIPLNVGAFFAVNNKLDVGAEFSDDLKNAGDFYSIALNVRYWVK